jgi:hypothetical protein
MTREQELARARKCFREFHGRWPRSREVMELQPSPAQGVFLVGDLVELMYRAKGSKFSHQFESPKPKVFCTWDQKQLLLIGGGYRFSGRGIVG